MLRHVLRHVLSYVRRHVHRHGVLQKAKNSIDAYGMDLVIANLLHTRKDEVIYFEKVPTLLGCQHCFITNNHIS